ncbi:MAG: ectonucleotide pyrophosphatase/phosphodiesterase [Candidatus Bipolaricaulota bacterium]|nr:ectonucleotide pyrophosphatase/phosphodiesterase [Candidatus Bipolaricaulota bacterium]MDW8111185.1 ectonucleotide pyrophosphatase/phosphodiesterase [Candidatus Bipolaricaulota bacterium]
MRFEFWVWLILLVLALIAPVGKKPVSVAEPPSQPSKPPPSVSIPELPPSFSISEAYLVVVVIDGLRPDALQRARTPHIDRLWQSGLYSWTAQTVMPSTTLPAIASLLSGVPPERHGIEWNYWAPERGRIAVPTIFTIAQAEKISTVAFVSKRKLEHLFGPETPLFVINNDARHVITAATGYMAEHRPRLVFVHLSDVDEVGHRHGWMTLQQLQAIERVDEALGLLLASLEELQMLDNSVIIVTSDHGGHGRIHGTDDPRDMTIPWILWTPKIETGRELTQSIRIYDTAATALAALGLAIPEDWLGVPVLEAFPEATLSEKP